MNPSPSRRFRLCVWLPGLLLFGSFNLTFHAGAQDARLTTPQPSRSQPKEEWLLQTFSVADGLLNDRVHTILEDPLGFLWVATSTGLSRFDGYNFSTLRSGQGDSTVFERNNTTVLYLDVSGNLWIGGTIQPSGLSRLDRSTGRLYTYRQDVSNPNSLMGDGILAVSSTSLEPDVLWISGHKGGFSTLSSATGLSRLDLETGLFTHFPFEANDPSTLPHAAYAFLEDPSGTFWGAGWGLNRFEPPAGSGQNPSDYTFTTFLPDSTLSFLEEEGINNLVYTLYVAPTEPGVLWAGGARGLHRFDLSTELFTSYYPFPGDTTDYRNAIASLYEDGSGTLLAGTFGAGLFTFDRRSGSFDRIEALPINVVHTIKGDRFGILWVGTNVGLAKLERRLNPFTTYQLHLDNPNSLNPNAVGSIHEDNAGHLWFGNEGTIHRLNRSTGIATHYPDWRAYKIYKDRAGTFWFSHCGDGLFRMKPDMPETVFRYRPDSADSTSIGQCTNPAIEDRAGNLWVTTWGDGLSLLDRQTDTFTHFRNRPNDANSLGNNYLLWVYEAPSEPGVLWLGSEEGIIRFNPETKSFSNYLFDTLRRAMMMHEDRQGRFWVATASNGLHRFNRETGVIEKTYTVDDGLAHNQVWSVYEDDQGFLWLSTSDGLSRFDAAAEAFTTYTTSDGLPHNQFSESSHFQSASGELFYGSPNGLVSFFPDQIEKNPVPPEVVLTGFRIAGEPVGIGPESPLEVSMSMTKSITLTYEQNDFTFEYVGIHSVAPAQTRYRVQLEGYDPGWIDAGTDRRASYSRLTPGDYVFRVNAVSGDGVWNETGASVAIRIKPPWWRTIWAYLLYGLLLAAGVFAFDRSQRRRILLKERERTRERELAQAREIEKAYTQLQATQQQLVHQEKMASLGALTAGIAHEIKNPLNFITNFAGLNDELATEMREALDAGASVDDLLSNIQRNSRIVVEHGRRADRIVQSMMRHASGASGERQRVALNSLVNEYVDLAFHGVRANRPGFEVAITREFDEAAGEVELVPQQIGQVLVNLFNNAFDAVEERRRLGEAYSPAVTVSTRRGVGTVEIRVMDNGVGIPPSVRDKIFEPFFTTKPAGSGTGLGLSLSYEIVSRGHGGSLTVESKIGEGTTFIITLPSSQ